MRKVAAVIGWNPVAVMYTASWMELNAFRARMELRGSFS